MRLNGLLILSSPKHYESQTLCAWQTDLNYDESPGENNNCG